ncbi:MAG: hypothetical protein N2169_07215, partial [bacterium]|nr:hypothetical protein [bacterium]
IEIKNTNTQLDTLVIDEGLLPKREYRYKAYRVDKGVAVDSSMELIVRTMDTTSHEFSWEITYLGDGASSVLYDVAIINDTLAYAVGEISVRDSNGQWINPPYNMAQWDGKSWKLKRIMYNYQGSDYYAPLHSVFAFSENDYWVGSNQPMKWNGTKWITFDLGSDIWNGWIKKIWGSNGNNVFIVGGNGAIAHFDGVRWRRIEITPESGQGGTDVDLTDVWGSPNGSIVWATAYSDDRYETYLLRYSGIDWNIAYDGTNSWYHTPDSISGVITSIWTNSKNKVFVGAGAGIFLCDVRLNWKSLLITPFGWLRTLPSRIRGEAINDIFIVGTYGFIGHYNGLTSKHYKDYWGPGLVFKSVSQKGNFVIAVGYLYGPIKSKATVFIGRR